MEKEFEVAHYECLQEALMIAIRRSKKDYIEVAEKLWPTLPERTRYGRLVDALNPDKNQKLSVDEVIYICNFCNSADPLYYFADQCGFERPKKKSIETEEVELKERLDAMFSEATKAYQKYLRLTEKRDQREKIQKGVVSFSDLQKKFAE